MRITTCTACGREREHWAHGWCRPCYLAWYRSGKPSGGPHARSPQTPKDRASRDARLIEFATLRADGVDLYDAGSAVGVSAVTARRYQRWIDAGMVPEATP